MIEADSVHSTPPLSMPTDVNKHRSGTPGLREANRLIWFVNLADNRGPDRRRSGPHPKRISSCYIKALRSSELGSRFGAYSQSVNGRAVNRRSIAGRMTVTPAVHSHRRP